MASTIFAANATHLFVCLGGSGTMSRYKLETREREVSARPRWAWFMKTTYEPLG